MAVLCAGGLRMRWEINRLWPNRDKRSDGWIGDPAHASRPSDHNPVNGVVYALDVDEDLNGRDGSDPAAANDLAQQIVDCAKAGDKRIKYVIFEGRIWSATSHWKPRPYTGPNSHQKHIHVSFTPAARLNGKTFGLTK